MLDIFMDLALWIEFYGFIEDLATTYSYKKYTWLT